MPIKKELTPARKIEVTPGKKTEATPAKRMEPNPGIRVPPPSTVIKQQQTQIIAKRKQEKNTLTGHTKGKAPVQEQIVAPTSQHRIITSKQSLNPDLVDVKTVKTQQSLIGMTPVSRSNAPTPIIRDTPLTQFEPKKRETENLKSIVMSRMSLNAFDRNSTAKLSSHVMNSSIETGNENKKTSEHNPSVEKSKSFISKSHVSIDSPDEALDTVYAEGFNIKTPLRMKETLETRKAISRANSSISDSQFIRDAE